MGRGNAVERALKAKQRLEEVAQAQSEIGKQVIAAIENGSDPEMVASLAESAAKNIVTTEEIIQKQELVVREQEQSKIRIFEDNLASQESVTIKFIHWTKDNSATRTLVQWGGVHNYILSLDDNGYASVPSDVAQSLTSDCDAAFEIVSSKNE
jgi:hypothetical protein